MTIALTYAVTRTFLYALISYEGILNYLVLLK
jgi:hypothetical protein